MHPQKLSRFQNPKQCSPVVAALRLFVYGGFLVQHPIHLYPNVVFRVNSGDRSFPFHHVTGEWFSFCMEQQIDNVFPHVVPQKHPGNPV